MIADAVDGAKYATSVTEWDEFANGSSSTTGIPLPPVLICSTHVYAHGYKAHFNGIICRVHQSYVKSLPRGYEPAISMLMSHLYASYPIVNRVGFGVDNSVLELTALASTIAASKKWRETNKLSSWNVNHSQFIRGDKDNSFAAN